MKIYLGADHHGYELKEKVAKWLFEWEHKFEDLGAEFLDPDDDYSLYANDVASLVAADIFSKGILLCGSGVGMNVAANKFDGVRASVGKNPDQVKAGRNDDDMNVLVIASDFTNENEAREMIKMFLETKFSGKARHERRLEEIEKIEANN
ncbi:MAG TPA: RpiB/LacA/LacB family sugar-phosphate isomerase [Alphaproteobacteria bacterium]|jgi:ribose 5-phosphate isomerase B|nr:RpiB/LacA/LacB family sugar-phosphate isomerase [Alphaproteobacteria bacterium]